MMQLRRSNERGHANHGWLDSYHSFSFADYYDPNFMGFRTLRVINEDRIAGGGGFPRHPHRDMEILTYIIEGELEHTDSMGNSEVIRRGDVQKMTAGTGVLHSEFNHSSENMVHLLQIWMLPDEKRLTPSYGQKNFSHIDNNFVLAASPDGAQDSIIIHQDIKLFMGKFKASEGVNYNLGPDRYGWLQMIKGNIKINGLDVGPGDGVAISEERELLIKASTEAEFLFFDLN